MYFNLFWCFSIGYWMIIGVKGVNSIGICSNEAAGGRAVILDESGSNTDDCECQMRTKDGDGPLNQNNAVALLTFVVTSEGCASYLEIDHSRVQNIGNVVKCGHNGAAPYYLLPGDVISIKLVTNQSDSTKFRFNMTMFIDLLGNTVDIKCGTAKTAFGNDMTSTSHNTETTTKTDDIFTTDSTSILSILTSDSIMSSASTTDSSSSTDSTETDTEETVSTTGSLSTIITTSSVTMEISPPDKQSKDKDLTPLIAGVTVGVILIICITVLMAIWLVRRKWTHENDQVMADTNRSRENITDTNRSRENTTDTNTHVTHDNGGRQGQGQNTYDHLNRSGARHDIYVGADDLDNNNRPSPLLPITMDTQDEQLQDTYHNLNKTYVNIQTPSGPEEKYDLYMNANDLDKDIQPSPSEYENI